MTEVDPLDRFIFELDVETDAAETEVIRIKKLADELAPHDATFGKPASASATFSEGYS